MEIQKARRVLITIITILVLLQLVATIFLSKSIFSSSVFLITIVCISTIFIFLFLGYIYTLGNKRLFNLFTAIVVVSIFIMMILTGVLISPNMLLFWEWELFLLILLISIVLLHRYYKLKLENN